MTIGKPPPGPFRLIELADGTSVPLYLVPFDEHGNSKGPETRDHLIAAIQNGHFTDVFLFSHGWNNDFDTAEKRYTEFLKGYLELRQTRKLKNCREIHPVLIGVIWPSTELVAPWEEGPGFAGGAPGPDMRRTSKMWNRLRRA